MRRGWARLVPCRVTNGTNGLWLRRICGLVPVMVDAVVLLLHLPPSDVNLS
jgi:hypothetical protein